MPRILHAALRRTMPASLQRGDYDMSESLRSPSPNADRALRERRKGAIVQQPFPRTLAMSSAALATEATVRPRRVLGGAAAAHALHDGFTEALLVLLPIWQAEMALSYAMVGLLKALYSGAMAAFQVPAAMLAGAGRGPLVLALGTGIAGLGLLVAGLSEGVILLAAGLFLSGLGSSSQHPIASDLVSRAYEGPRSRPALGSYNFAGDLGKVAVPAAVALLLTMTSWRSATLLLGAGGLVFAVLLLVLLPRAGLPAAAQPAEGKAAGASTGSRRGFAVLLAIGIIDSATRAGLLTFLPFLLAEKGADLPTVGLALTLIFAGGAAGKLACGFLGARLGTVRTVWLTEGATALGILLLLPLPLWAALVLLPPLGLALNGTSSVLYGSVPDYVPPAGRARAFGIFYTGSIGGSAVSPVLYGLFSDAMGLQAMLLLVAAAVMSTLPLAAVLRERSGRLDGSSL